MVFKSRKLKLDKSIWSELSKKNVDANRIFFIIDEYEKDNLDTIDKLRRDRKVEMTKINGAIKQSINAHGAITKDLITSASKRIYGALMVNPNSKKEFKAFSFRDIIIGIILGLLITLLV